MEVEVRYGDIDGAIEGEAEEKLRSTAAFCRVFLECVRAFISR